jgi:hypothetical protein
MLALIGAAWIMQASQTPKQKDNRISLPHIILEQNRLQQQITEVLSSDKDDNRTRPTNVRDTLQSRQLHDEAQKWQYYNNAASQDPVSLSNQTSINRMGAASGKNSQYIIPSMDKKISANPDMGRDGIDPSSAFSTQKQSCVSKC